MWYKRFGHDANPFDTNPFTSHYSLISHEITIKRLIEELYSSNMTVLVGAQGSGKTAVLAQIGKRIKKCHYLDAQTLTRQIDIESILPTKQGIITRLIQKKSQAIILLIDNAQHLTERSCEKIKYLFDQNSIKSVVFATTNAEALKFSPSMKDRIQDTIILQPINEYEALRIIRERFTNQQFLSDSAILKVYDLCNQNIQKTLLAINTICKNVVEQGKGEVLPKHLTALFKKQTGDWSVLEAQHEA